MSGGYAMPGISLPTLLLAASAAVSADLQLQETTTRQAETMLCFRGDGQLVSYQLEMLGQGPGGRSRSRQSGQLRAEAELRCPLRDRVQINGASRVEARLRWWVEGVEQEPASRTLQLQAP